VTPIGKTAADFGFETAIQCLNRVEKQSMLRDNATGNFLVAGSFDWEMAGMFDLGSAEPISRI
jgi:hypothetical protein